MRNHIEHHSKMVMLDFSIPLIRSASQKMSKTSSPPGTRSLCDKQLAQLLQNTLHFPRDTAKDIPGSSPKKGDSFPSIFTHL